MFRRVGSGGRFYTGPVQKAGCASLLFLPDRLEVRYRSRIGEQGTAFSALELDTLSNGDVFHKRLLLTACEAPVQGVLPFEVTD
jgi:hypothetical protein